MIIEVNCGGNSELLEFLEKMSTETSNKEQLITFQHRTRTQGSDDTMRSPGQNGNDGA